MIKTLALALVASTALFACKKDSKTDTTEPEKPDTKADAGKKEAPSPVEAARAIMEPYEACRAKLADDQPSIAGCAADVASAARANQAALEGGGAAAAGEIAKAADALAKMPAGDIEKLRVGFGEVSKPTEAMLAAVPEAAEGYKVYECPMAKGFNRWLQPDQGADHQMANPYMGKKMLQCGAEVDIGEGGETGQNPGGSEDLLAAEMKAHEAARPVLDKHCSSCHTRAGKGPKKSKRKALKHFVMDGYPYTGHHADELGETIREVLGVGGEEATMPADDPGSVKGAELAKIVAWTRAWDRAAEAKVGHHAEMGHDDHEH